MSLIHVKNLTFGYEGSYCNIFENVSFMIDTEWKLGLVGRNGRGKTTFLNLLIGKYPYSGKIISDTDFIYFPFYISDKSEFTMDVLNKIAPQVEDWEFIKELSLLDMSADILYRSFETLSGGEQTKALLSALFLRQNQFLLIDEPTNHLDVTSRNIIGEYLRKKKSFILISHDRKLLDSCTDHTLSINKTNIEVLRGNFSIWWEQNTKRELFEITQNERLLRDIERLSKASKQAKAWSDKAESRKIGFNPVKTEKSLNRRPIEGKKSKKMMAHSKAIQKRKQAAIEEKASLLKNIEVTENLKINTIDYYKNLFLECKDLSLFYGEKQVNEPITFNVNQGEKIALTGINGCGKSTLLKLLMGKKIDYTGVFNISSQLRISYVGQDTSNLCGKLHDYAEVSGIDESFFKAILRKLDFSRTQFDKPIETFSSGQKKKVLIAKSLSEKAHLYLWDEPLNFIDVFSRIQIEELIKNSSATMIFVEHDKTFTDKISSRKVQIQKKDN